MDTSRRTRMWDRVSSILEEVDPTRVMDTSRILRLQISNGLSESELYHALLSHYQDKDSSLLLLQLHISVLSEMWLEWLNQVSFPSAVTRREVSQFSSKKKKKENEKVPNCSGPLDVVKDGAVLYRLLRDAVEFRQCVKSGFTCASFANSTTSEPSTDYSCNCALGGGGGLEAPTAVDASIARGGNFASAKNGCGNSTLVSCGNTPLIDSSVGGKQRTSIFTAVPTQSQIKRHRRLRITSTAVEVCPLVGKVSIDTSSLPRQQSAMTEVSTKEPSSSTSKSTTTPFSPNDSDLKAPDSPNFVDRQSSAATYAYHYDANDGGDGAFSTFVSPTEHTEDDDGPLASTGTEAGDGTGDGSTDAPHKALQEAMENINYVCAICREYLGWKEKDEIFSVGDLACVYDDDVVVKRLHWIALALYKFVNNAEVVPMPPLMSYVVYGEMYPGVAEEDQNNIAIGVAMLSSCLPQTHHLGITLRETRVYLSHATSQVQPFELPCCLFENNVFCYYADRTTPFWYVVRHLLEQWDKLAWIAETPLSLKSMVTLLKDGAKQRSIPTVTITLSSQSATTSTHESGVFLRPDIMQSPLHTYDAYDESTMPGTFRGVNDPAPDRPSTYYLSTHSNPTKSHSRAQVKESEMSVGKTKYGNMSNDPKLSKSVSYLDGSHRLSSVAMTQSPSIISTQPNRTDIFEEEESAEDCAEVKHTTSEAADALVDPQDMTYSGGVETVATVLATAHRAEEIICSMNTASMRCVPPGESMIGRSTNSSFGLHIPTGPARMVHASPLVQHNAAMSWNEYAETSYGSAAISPLIFGGQEGSWSVRGCAPMHNFTATVIHEYEGKVAVTEHQFRMSGKPIGRGAFGAVYKALDMNCGATVAVKQSKVAVDGEFNINERELGLWSMIPAHPNVITFYGASRERDTNHILLVIEYADGGNIGSLYQTFSPIKEQLFQSHAMQFAQGLKHLHDHGVVHGDVKPENVMTRSDGKVAIGDFGCSRLLQRGDKPKAKGRQENLGVFGTAHYMAPETIDAASCYKSDVWAYACTLVCIWTNKLPWFECGVMSKDAIPLMFHIATCKDWPYSEEYLNRSTPRWLLRVAHRAFQRDVELRCNMVEVISILSEYME